MMAAGRRLWTTTDRFINPARQRKGKEIDLWISLAGSPEASGQAVFCGANIRVD
jgi:hypothetical protein